MDKSAIRDAATIILLRLTGGAPSVLMGQRGSKAAFMPDKFVFPGGAVDPDDHHVPLAAPLPSPCHERVANGSALPPEALAAAAIRELWEETGQLLGVPMPWRDAPEGWRGFSARGLRPAASALRFVFRAITPPGRPRRFDARFFLADAGALSSDPDDFAAASGELSHLQWIPLAAVREFDLPFITKVVLAEIARSPDPSVAPAGVPFFQNSDEGSFLSRIGDPLA